MCQDHSFSDFSFAFQQIPNDRISPTCLGFDPDPSFPVLFCSLCQEGRLNMRCGSQAPLLRRVMVSFHFSQKSEGSRKGEERDTKSQVYIHVWSINGASCLWKGVTRFHFPPGDSIPWVSPTLSHPFVSSIYISSDFLLLTIS